MEQKQEIFEYRGVDDFCLARIIQDDENGYECETPIQIPVQEVGKSTDSSSEPHYYDNKPMLTVNSESADTISLVVAPPELKVLSQIIGKHFDEELGMMVDSERANDYYAIMYRTKGTDGHYRYVSRCKGTFGIPEESSKTEDGGTDTTNTTLTFTGIATTYEFEKGKFNKDTKKWEKAGVKGIVVDDRYGKADLSAFFDSVQTPDTIKAKVAEPSQSETEQISDETSQEEPSPEVEVQY